MIEFLAMDGYAGFVWTSYGLTALAAGGLVWWALSGRARARARLARIQASAARDSLGGEDPLARGDAPDSGKTGHAP
ncbi:heme exporter protein CcmD [Marinicauda algicola]|uniref:Heme exporter protein D n=1 Tax=Marinicauda algicola TaxID=2029849 RepID=A0A4S2H1Z4_9PROT|nr:heme exporter protein CcmD [Marinicauda algicola]TGY89318.1 heme exporter protein CcmD [Marinicauda algicola]